MWSICIRGLPVKVTEVPFVRITHKAKWILDLCVLEPVGGCMQDNVKSHPVAINGKQQANSEIRVLSYGMAPRRALRVRLSWQALVCLLAVAGIVGLLLLVPVWVDSNDRRDSSMAFDCASQLRAIGRMLNRYADDHGGQLPDCLGESWIQRDLQREGCSWNGLFVCPADTAGLQRHAAEGAVNATALRQDMYSSYVYLGRGVAITCDRLTPVLVERASNHRSHKAMHVLYLDGHVEMLPETETKEILSAATRRVRKQ